jgi:hypothetical protein
MAELQLGGSGPHAHPSRRWQSPTVIAEGGLSARLGVAVLIGWYTHRAVLLPASLASVPIQPTTAAGFLLSGIAVLFTVVGWPYLVRPCGGVVTGLGGLTMLQYLLTVDCGIDLVSVLSDLTVGAFSPGSMARTTALSVALTGIALLLRSLPVSQHGSTPNGSSQSSPQREQGKQECSGVYAASLGQ